MLIYKSNHFSDLYFRSLSDLMYSPQYETMPRDLKIKENTNVTLVLEDPLSCLYLNDHRSSKLKYISAELLWYFMGRNDAAFIQEYASFWSSIQNEDGTVNSSYGHLIFSESNRYGYSQYVWALNSLLKDPDSRQAVLHFNLPQHQYESNKDFVCTMYGIFQIRNNQLDFTISMRSNDVIWGLPTDIAFFAILQCQMLSHLRKKYPTLTLGKYTHIANSFHVYERHFSEVSKMLTSEFIPQTIPGLVEDFVNELGQPTQHFEKLFALRSDSYELMEDSLSRWIIKNINE